MATIVPDVPDAMELTTVIDASGEVGRAATHMAAAAKAATTHGTEPTATAEAATAHVAESAATHVTTAPMTATTATSAHKRDVRVTARRDRVRWGGHCLRTRCIQCCERRHA
jgi:hypothetical protein